MTETVEAVREIVDNGCTPAPRYAQRIADTFVLRDGRSCERVTHEIEQLDRPATTSAEHPVSPEVSR